MTELYSADEIPTVPAHMLPPDLQQYFEPALCGQCFVCHLVDVFREVRRVLRDDGTVWLNLGDSYAGSGKGPPGPNAAIPHEERQGFKSNGKHITPVGFKQKDLLMMPFRVAMALQADGWWLRSVIPWLKRNAMPESVTDRPATSVEYVFLLAKSARYYWDADAVRVASPENHPMAGGKRFYAGTIPPGHPTEAHPDKHHNGLMTGAGREPSRNRRNSDWFFESWQGLLLDEQDAPLALVVNPQPFSGAHFATFPPKLVEPMVKASTRPGETVLDPFGGSGTVGLVADRLGRNAVLCELKPSYAEMGTDRIIGDAPMFVELAAD